MSLLLLSACGGGGGGGDAGTSAPSYVTWTLYQDFELGNIAFGIPLSSSSGPSQIEYQAFTYNNVNQTYKRYNAVVTGTFNLPQISSASDAGATGTVNTITYSIDGQSVYRVSGLSLSAANFISLKTNWRELLKAISASSTNGIATGTGHQLTCATGSVMVQLTTTAQDITEFLKICSNS